MRYFVLVFLLLLSACQNSKQGPDVTKADFEEPTKILSIDPKPWDQWSDKFPSWVNAVEPFQVLGNVYYVGSEGLSSFLITSDNGHILIDGTLPQNVPQIVNNIETLGFEIEDVKILLNSHAHFDHSGGLKALKDLTGAKLIAHEGDRSALEGGFYLGAEFNDNYAAPKVTVDEVISDGALVELGDIQLKANLTPGHSRGCTSWTMPVSHLGEIYNAVFFCSATVAGNRLIPEQYDGIVEGYKTTFDKTRDWKPDIFLSNHPSFFNMKEKREKLKAGDDFAFIDLEGFPAMMKRLEADFESKFEDAKTGQADLERRISNFVFDSTKIDKSAEYIFYSHGRIIELQGVPAYSSKFGYYQYADILETLEHEGFIVFSEPRGSDVNVTDNATTISRQVQVLLDAGVPSENITIVGASKGAYIASLISQELANPRINIVLLAGCSRNVVTQMTGADFKLFGDVLTIRDIDDVDLAGSCAAVLKSSSGVSDYQEIVTQENLSHGLIYTPHEAWITPTIAWARH